MKSMDEEQAISKAQKISDADGVVMAVYFNPYAEYETDRWGFMPKAAIGIFKHCEIRYTIFPR